MQTDARVSLQESLDSLTNDESPPLNGLLRVDYIVLRRVNARKNHVHVEFVDGDVKDGNEWSEGPVPVYTTIERLFAMKDTMDRGARREVFGRRKLSDGKHFGPLIGKEGWYEEHDESSGSDDMVAVHADGAGSENGANSDGSGKMCLASHLAPRLEVRPAPGEGLRVKSVQRGPRLVSMPGIVICGLLMRQKPRPVLSYKSRKKERWTSRIRNF